MAATILQHRPPLPPDRALPGADDLLGPGGVALVTRFLEERGTEPHGVEPVQAHYRPGLSLAVCYRASGVDRSSGRPFSLTITAEHRTSEQGAAEPERIWAFPDDPALPGLRDAADQATVARRLRVRKGDVTLEPLRYLPRRRAVLRYRLADGTTLFAKVVTPARARRLQGLAEALLAPGGTPGQGDPGRAATAGTPSTWGRPPDGTGAPGGGAAGLSLSFALPVGRVGRGALVFPCAPGRSLRDLLLAGGPLPAPGRLAALPAETHRLCHPALAGAADPADLRSRRRFDPAVTLAAAQVVTRLLPSRAGDAARLAEALVTSAEASEAPDDGIVHGDLYENQILVDGDRLALIDLDDLGPGDPLLDAANLSAHLFLLATSGAPAAGLIGRYRDEVLAASARALDVAPAELAWRESYCLLRLVSGPFRVLHPDWPARMAARLTLATEALSARSARL